MCDCRMRETVRLRSVVSSCSIESRLVSSPPMGAVCQASGMGTSPSGSPSYQPPQAIQPSHSSVSSGKPVMSL